MSLSLETTAFTSLESSGADASAASAGASRIPGRFAMRAVPGGQNVSIPYSWGDAPTDTRSFALTLIDSAPVAHDWVHWMVIDVSPSAHLVPEGASGARTMPEGAVELRNTFGFIGYGGPQPPKGTGVHGYVATIYALDVERINLPAGATLQQFRSAVAGHVLATATCTGTFSQ
jgi:Raf kinase inhibitor-like YbhB/YbcL family protein